jgi:hypothetical protein
MSDEKGNGEHGTPPWSCLMIVFILANMFWWFMFAGPFLVLLTRATELLVRLCAGIDRISPP